MMTLGAVSGSSGWRKWIGVLLLPPPPERGSTDLATQAWARVFLTGALVLLTFGAEATGELPELILSARTAAIVALAAAAALVAVSRSHLPVTWLGLMASGVDVTLVSLGPVLLGLATTPTHAAGASLMLEAYFLAIALAALGPDARACLLAGGLTLVEYTGILAWAATDDSAAISWSTHLARWALLVLATILARLIVGLAGRLRLLSTRDHLTGLHNRRHFDDRLQTEVIRAWRYRRPFSVAVIDIDHFKRFNDAHGHATGDAALRTVAGVLRTTFRVSDLLARYGGEEFVVLMPETTHAEAVAKVEEARAAMTALPRVVEGRSGVGVITVSCGVASAPEDGSNARLLMQCADSRLYQAKEAGRNQTLGRPPALSSAAPITGVL